MCLYCRFEVQRLVQLSQCSCWKSQNVCMPDLSSTLKRLLWMQVMVDWGWWKQIDTYYKTPCRILQCIGFIWHKANTKFRQYFQPITKMVKTHVLKVFHVRECDVPVPWICNFLVVLEPVSGKTCFRKKVLENFVTGKKVSEPVSEKNGYLNWFLLPKFRNFEDLWLVPVPGFFFFSCDIGTGVGKKCRYRYGLTFWVHHTLFHQQINLQSFKDALAEKYTYFA